MNIFILFYYARCFNTASFASKKFGPESNLSSSPPPNFRPGLRPCGSLCKLLMFSVCLPFINYYVLCSIEIFRKI